MCKNNKKLYSLLLVAFLLLSPACHVKAYEEVSVKPISAYFHVFDEIAGEFTKAIQQNIIGKVNEFKTTKIANETKTSAFELPDNAFIIEVERAVDGNQKVLALKDDCLQFYFNQDKVCETKIPIPAEVSLGTSFGTVIGNPYISVDGDLVLIQSYTTIGTVPAEDRATLDYTILAKSCSRIIPSYCDNGYVFQDCEGRYGLVFSQNIPQFIGYPYEGFYFIEVGSNFRLPEPEIIWLDESSVKSVNFGSYFSTTYGHIYVRGISVRLDVESYGEIDIKYACDMFEAVEVDHKFLGLLDTKFKPQEYNERLSIVLQTLEEYK